MLVINSHREVAAFECRKTKDFSYNHPSVVIASKHCHCTEQTVLWKTKERRKIMFFFFMSIHQYAWHVDLHSWKHLLHSCQCQHPISISRTSWVQTNRAVSERSRQCCACQRLTHFTPCPLCSPMTTWTTSLYLSNPKSVEEMIQPLRLYMIRYLSLCLKPNFKF